MLSHRTLRLLRCVLVCILWCVFTVYNAFLLKVPVQRVEVKGVERATQVSWMNWLQWGQARVVWNKMLDAYFKWVWFWVRWLVSYIFIYSNMGSVFFSRMYVIFLYTNNKLTQKETRETTYFTIALPKDEIRRNQSKRWSERPIYWKL